MRRSRQSHDEEDEEGSDGELNLTPYLDMITTLVIYLVFTFQIVIEFRMIELLPPELGKGTGAAKDPEATVTLFMRADGYLLLASEETTQFQATIQIPKVADKAAAGKQTFDVVKLHETLKQWKKDYRLGESLIVVGETGTPYRDVVSAMDAVRMDEGKVMFPAILFGAPIGAASAAPAPSGG